MHTVTTADSIKKSLLSLHRQESKVQIKTSQQHYINFLDIARAALLLIDHLYSSPANVHN